MLTHVFANAWFIIDIFVHNMLNSLNLDEDHNIDELSEGEPQSFKIPYWWVVFQRVTSNGKGSGIYHSNKEGMVDLSKLMVVWVESPEADWFQTDLV